MDGLFKKYMGAYLITVVCVSVFIAIPVYLLP